jgi:serine/threonine protein kinase
MLPSGCVFAERFEIVQPMASGGMGVVYQALDRSTGKLVALKLLQATVASAEDAERFAREAKLLSELCHPNIVSYVTHGETPAGERYLVMEWLHGEDLATRLLRGPLSVNDAVELLRRTAEALSLSHSRGIVHRVLLSSKLSSENR